MNGVNTAQKDMSALRKQISFVTQDTQLFPGTIKENLEFVAQEASEEDISQQELIKEKNILKNLKNTIYFKKRNTEKIFYSVLISTNVEFIKWIQLRIGYFENINTPLFNEDLKSDGIYLDLNSLTLENPKLILKDNSIGLCPEILIKQFQYGLI
jgi:hypothetical protein